MSWEFHVKKEKKENQNLVLKSEGLRGNGGKKWCEW